MLRSQDKRAVRIFAFVLAAAVATLLVLPGLYYYGLSLVPQKPRLSAAAPAPAIVRAALWARLSGHGPARLHPVSPWSFVLFETCLAAARHREDFETCRQDHPGVLVAGVLAGAHVTEQRSALAEWQWHLAQAATAAWLTRRWKADDVLNEIAWRTQFGHGWRGIEEAARGYFGKPAGELEVHEAALLAALVPDPDAPDPWCRPKEATAGRNRVLWRMAENDTVSQESLGRLLSEPLGVVPGGCDAAGSR